MQIVPPKLHKRVMKRLKECEKLTGVHCPDISVVYDITGRLGGEALTVSRVIRLNPAYLNAYTDDYITNIVAHEWAHIVNEYLHGPLVKAHGNEWRAIMEKLGLVPDRCHSYKNTPGMKVRVKHKVFCPTCKTDVLVGSNVHGKISAGHEYTHIECGGLLTFAPV